jgi:hypothetical protein
MDRQFKGPPPEPVSRVPSLILFGIYLLAMAVLVVVPVDATTKLRLQLAINVIACTTFLVMAVVYARRSRRNRREVSS